MPIYEYNCAKCGAEFEYLTRSADDAPQKCPKCSSKKILKQLSSFATGSPSRMPESCGGCANAAACPAAGSPAAGCCGGH